MGESSSVGRKDGEFHCPRCSLCSNHTNHLYFVSKPHHPPPIYSNERIFTPPPRFPGAGWISVSSLQRGPPDHPTWSSQAGCSFACLFLSQHSAVCSFPSPLGCEFQESRNFLCQSQVQRKRRGNLRWWCWGHSAKCRPLAQGRGWFEDVSLEYDRRSPKQTQTLFLWPILENKPKPV